MGTFFQLIMFVASTIYQISQYNRLKRKMEEEADKRRGFRVTVRGKATPIPVVYGKQMLGGIEVRHRVSEDYTYAASNSGAIVFDEGIGNTNVTGTKHEFLYVQSALCQDGIEDVVYLNVDGKPYNLEDEKFTHRIVINKNGGVAEPLATANGLASTNKFTGTAFATAVYRLNREEPQYNGIPALEFFVKGRKVRSVVSAPGGYTLSSTYSYSNNPALCLLDYLLNPNFGKGLSVNDIDLASFYQAAQVCDTVVLPSATAYGRINNFRPVLDFSSLVDFPDVGSETYLYQALNTGTLYSWDNDTGQYSVSTETASNRPIPLYECNITLDTSAKIRDNIESILQTMGLAELIWSSEGKYKLLLEYPENQSELQALVDPTHYFDESSIIRNNVELNWIPVNDRYNHVTVRYLNEHEDFKEDSISWPPKTGSVYQTYYSEDNNQQLSTEIFFEGCSDPYHAQAKAEQMVRQSRGMYMISLTVNKQGLTLEPGDFFSVSLASQNISNEIFRVESMEVSEDLTVKISGYKFDSAFLAWNISDDAAYGSRPGVDPVLPGPAFITATDVGFVNEDGFFMPAVKLDWPAANDSSVRSYELQYKISTDAVFNSYRTNLLTHTITGLKTGTQYTFRVRAVGNTGKLSNFATVVHTVGGDSTAPTAPTGLTATGHFKYINLTWTNPADPDFNFIEVYENTVNSYTGAQLVGTTRGNTFVRANLGLSETKYYYVRAIDNTGNASENSNIASATTTFLDDPDFENGIYSLFTEQGLFAIKDVTGLPASGSFLGEKVFNRNDGKLYEWDGTAWVAVVADIEDLSITTAKIANAAVEAGKLAANAVTTEKLNALAVTAEKVAASAITTAKIANEAVEAGKLAANAVTTDKLDALAVTAAKVADSAITTTKISDSAVSSSKLAANSVTAIKIATDAITETKIAADAISSPKIQAGAIVAGKLSAGAVEAGNISAGAIQAADIAAGTITGNKIAANTLTASNIASETITASQIAAGTITGAKIAAETIESANIKAGTIQAADIAAGTITSNEIATGTITATNIAAGTITANEIASNAITTDKLAANSVTSAKIVAGTIQASDIAAGTITANEIATGTITASKIAASTITGDKIAANTITGGLISASGIITNSAQINDGLITNAKIANAAITTAKIQDASITNAKIADLSADKITAGTISVDRLPGLSDLAATVNTGFYVQTGSSFPTQTVTVSQSGIVVGSKSLIILQFRIIGPGGSDDTSQAVLSSSSSGFSTTNNTWNGVSYVQGVFGSGVYDYVNLTFIGSAVAASSSISASFTFTAQSTRRFNVQNLKFLMLTVEA